MVSRFRGTRYHLLPDTALWRRQGAAMARIVRVAARFPKKWHLSFVIRHLSFALSPLSLSPRACRWPASLCVRSLPAVAGGLRVKAVAVFRRVAATARGAPSAAPPPVRGAKKAGGFLCAGQACALVVLAPREYTGGGRRTGRIPNCESRPSAAVCHFGSSSSAVADDQ